MNDSERISSVNRPRDWAHDYARDDAPWDTGRPCPELIRVIEEHSISPCRAVDLGCGTGTNAIELARRGFQVTAIDGVSQALDIGRTRANSERVPVAFVEDNLLELTQDFQPFDFLFDRGCYHEVRLINLPAYLATLNRLTHPGSMYLVLAGNADEPMEGGPPVVTRAQLREELTGLFEVHSIDTFRADTSRSDRSPLFYSALLRRED